MAVTYVANLGAGSHDADVGGLDELALALDWDSEAAVLLMWAYFDESGHTQDPRARNFGIGGALAPLYAWKNLEVDWRVVLKAEAIAATHMTDIARCRGDFADKKVWPVERRDALVRRCLAISRARLIPANAMYLRENLPLPSSGARPDVDDAYIDLFKDILRSVAVEKKRVGPEPINLMFAEHPEIPADRLARYVKLCRESGLGDITIGEPARHPALQFADMVAFIVGEGFRPIDGFGPFFHDLVPPAQSFIVSWRH